MKGSVFLSTIDKLQAQNRLLGLALIVMLAFNIWNWTSLQRAMEKTQTVIVPIGGEGMMIGNGEADPRYIRRMARYITNMAGTYSAGNARQKFQELLSLFPPSKVGKAQVVFEQLATDIERYPSIASEVLWSGKEPLKYTSEMIQVSTIKTRLVNGKATERATVYYCLPYSIEDTQFYLHAIKERKGAGEDLCFLDEPSDAVQPGE